MRTISKLNYLDNIPVVPEEKLILLRMGYHPNKTVLSVENRRQLEDSIRAAFSLCHNQGVWSRLKIVRHEADMVELEGGYLFRSKDLARRLTQSDQVLLMSATVGKEITERIAAEVAGGKATLGIVMDAVASEMADACLDYIEVLVNKGLRKEGRCLIKHRYSPGYGDLSLEHQKIAYALLQLDKLGVTLTDRCLLIPEKSVIAISGIERIENDPSRV